MNIIDTDILVIGSGAAGLRASATASGCGVQVVVLNKGKFVNCTLWADKTYEIAGGGGCGFAAPLIPPDNPEKYYEDLSKVAEGRNIPELTYLFAEKSIDAFLYLKDSGVRFKKTQEGNPFAVPEIWHSFPRILYSEYGTGKEIIRVLKAEAISSGAKILDGFHAFRLLVRDGEITGCLAFSQNSKELTCFRCKAIILATGGAGRVFQYTTNPAGITGDGILLASDAGAELINMDLYSDIPMSLRPVYGLGFVPQLLFAGVGASVEELLKSPEILWSYNPSKLSLYEFQSKFPKTFKKLKSIGFNLDSDTIDLHWMAHFMLGGVHINTKAETSVKGLYAAGEIAGGITGKGRLPGTGIAEGIVFGEIAGKNSSAYVKGLRYSMLDKNILENKYSITRILSQRAFQELKQIKNSLSQPLYKALRDKMDSFIKFTAVEFTAKEKEINRLLGAEYTEFIPSQSQSKTIFELKSVLIFGKLYLKERTSLPEGAMSVCYKKYKKC